MNFNLEILLINCVVKYSFLSRVLNLSKNYSLSTCSVFPSCTICRLILPRLSVWSIPHNFGVFFSHLLCTFISHAENRKKSQFHTLYIFISMLQVNNPWKVINTVHLRCMGTPLCISKGNNCSHSSSRRTPV